MTTRQEVMMEVVMQTKKGEKMKEIVKPSLIPLRERES